MKTYILLSKNIDLVFKQNILRSLVCIRMPQKIHGTGRATLMSVVHAPVVSIISF